jgi:hypothetical protein
MPYCRYNALTRRDFVRAAEKAEASDSNPERQYLNNGSGLVRCSKYPGSTDCNFSSSVLREAAAAKGIVVIDRGCWLEMMQGVLSHEGDEENPGPARTIAGFVVHQPSHWVAYRRLERVPANEHTSAQPSRFFKIDSLSPV